MYIYLSLCSQYGYIVYYSKSMGTKIMNDVIIDKDYLFFGFLHFFTINMLVKKSSINFKRLTLPW